MLPTIGKLARLAGTAAALIAISTQAQALTFTYNFTAGTSAAAQNAFIDAGARWSAVFSDNVNVILTVGTAALNPGVLAQAGSTRNVTSYAVFRNQVVFDATTATDATAVANLQTGPNLNVLINGTADNPNGAGSLTPYLDNTGPNTSTINLTTANAKALGFTPTLGTVGGRCIGLCDAFIQFSTNFAFDTNPNDGITAGEFDFVGIATHEIGHALGFVSGVDVLDGNISPNGPFPDNLSAHLMSFVFQRPAQRQARLISPQEPARSISLSMVARPLAQASRLEVPKATVVRRATSRIISALESWTQPRGGANCSRSAAMTYWPLTPSVGTLTLVQCQSLQHGA
jgi:hypothetical protein